MTVFSTGSCLWFREPVWRFRVPVSCNASLFCVMCRRITQHVWGGGGHTMKKWHIMKKGDALQKTDSHNLQTSSRNHKQEQLLSPSTLDCNVTILVSASISDTGPFEGLRQIVRNIFK